MQYVWVPLKRLFLGFSFLCFFCSKTGLAGTAFFRCKFALALINENLLESKSHSRSLIKNSFLGKARAGREGVLSYFVRDLRAVLAEAPPIERAEFQRDAFGPHYLKTVLAFQSWYEKVKQVFLEELERQRRSPEEILVYERAFDAYQERIREMQTNEYMRHFENYTGDNLAIEVIRSLVTLRHAIAEVVFASTKQDLVCISCKAPKFLEILFNTTAENPEFQHMLADFFPNEETRTFLKGEIDAAYLTKDGRLKVVEFKFNSPVFPDHRYEHGNLSWERADKYAWQLFRMSRLLDLLRNKAPLFSKYGFTLELPHNPELIFSPLSPYRIEQDPRLFIKNAANAIAPQNVEIKYRPVLNDEEMEAIFSSLLD